MRVPPSPCSALVHQVGSEPLLSSFSALWGYHWCPNQYGPPTATIINRSITQHEHLAPFIRVPGKHPAVSGLTPPSGDRGQCSDPVLPSPLARVPGFICLLADADRAPARFSEETAATSETAGGAPAQSHRATTVPTPPSD